MEAVAKRSPDSGPAKKISEKTRLKQERAYLRRQIRRCRNVINLRQQVKDLRGKLDDLQFEIQEGNSR